MEESLGTNGIYFNSVSNTLHILPSNCSMPCIDGVRYIGSVVIVTLRSIEKLSNGFERMVIHSSHFKMSTLFWLFKTEIKKYPDFPIDLIERFLASHIHLVSHFNPFENAD